ncbi:MAG: ABC transporter substrate-binding protein, partial [Hoylesella buccalis]
MKKLLLLAVLLIVLVACQQSTTERQQVTKAQREKLRQENAEALKIAVLPTLDCLPLYVAQKLRLFDTLHVDVRLKPFTAQMDADTAIVGGSVEGIMSDLVRMERLKRKGLKLDYLSATNLQWQLISNKTARLKQLNQLGDKMVAMTRFSGTDYLTDESLKGVKTKSRVYKVQINDVHVRLHMLLNNEMDAMWLTEPQATTARLYHHQ